MSDYIRKEDALHNIEVLCAFHKAGLRKKDVREAIASCPSANVIERKSGEWERIPYSMTDYGRRCNLCHFKVGSTTNYCPNCGARMKGTDDER